MTAQRYWSVVLEGVGMAQGELVTLLPGDAENDSYEILAISRNGSCRHHRSIYYRKNVRSWQRRLISKAYKGIINLSLECC